ELGGGTDVGRERYRAGAAAGCWCRRGGGPFGRGLDRGGGAHALHVGLLVAPGGAVAVDLGGALGGGEDADLPAGDLGQVVQGQPAEDVVDHRLGDADVRVVGHPGRLETHVGELADVG